MAIDSQHTSTTDRDAAIESHKDARARAFLIIGAAALAVALIIAAVVHFTGTKTPTTPVATRPSEATVETQDKAAAIKTVQLLSAALDKAQKTGSVSGLEKLADYNLVQNSAKFIEATKAAGYTYDGETVLTFTSTEWQRTSTFNRLVTVKVCQDSSKVVLRDAQGKPLQNVNPDGTPNNRKRVPFTYYVDANLAGSGQSTYKVKDSAPDPNVKATC